MIPRNPPDRNPPVRNGIGETDTIPQKAKPWTWADESQELRFCPSAAEMIPSLLGPAPRWEFS